MEDRLSPLDRTPDHNVADGLLDEPEDGIGQEGKVAIDGRLN